MDNPVRNQWEITQKGRDFLVERQGIIKFADLQKLWPESGQAPNAATPSTSESVDITPDEQMAISHRQHLDRLSDDILDSLKGLTPAGFERLVVEFLSKLGYGEGTVVGRSGDQGVDGILNQDKLGLEKVFTQAKRHASGQGGGTRDSQLFG